MVDFDKVMQALSDGSHRQVPVGFRDEEQIHSFSDDGDERNRAVTVRHAHFPLLGETDLLAWRPETGIVSGRDDFETVGSTPTALEGRRGAVSDDPSPDGGQTC